jgi:hypothetical protein
VKFSTQLGQCQGKKNYSDKDIPKAHDFVEKEINEFDEVMEGHEDFCALVASRGITALLLRLGAIT